MHIPKGLSMGFPTRFISAGVGIFVLILLVVLGTGCDKLPLSEDSAKELSLGDSVTAGNGVFTLMGAGPRYSRVLERWVTCLYYTTEPTGQGPYRSITPQFRVETDAGDAERMVGSFTPAPGTPIPENWTYSRFNCFEVPPEASKLWVTVEWGETFNDQKKFTYVVPFP